MSVQNGTAILMSVEGNIIKGTTSHDLSLTADMIETTTKDSGGDKEYIAGERDGTVTVEGRYDDAASPVGYSELFAYYKAGTQLTCVYGLQAVGKKAYTFEAQISSLNNSAPENEAATFSVDLQITGGVTEVTLT